MQDMERDMKDGQVFARPTANRFHATLLVAHRYEKYKPLACTRGTMAREGS